VISLDMEVVLQMWERNLGVKVEIQQTEFATFLKDLNRRRFQMFDIGWIADYPDPENFLDILFHSESHNNHTNYSSPEVDRLLELARTESDEAARFQIYHQAEQQILDDAPWVPLWYSGERYVLVKPNVEDYYQTPLIIPRLRYVYLTDD
jgi:oligopeptide transport system substrate-binding protein